MNDLVRTQTLHATIYLGLALISLVLIFFTSSIAFAAPPATTASCAGIKQAYPILGTQCEKKYSNISHAPANEKQRLETFRARTAVLEIFRKAMLCNGLFGADKTAQQRFRSGEEGHLTALNNLRVAMDNAGDANLPAAYTAENLKAISIKKQQCK